MFYNQAKNLLDSVILSCPMDKSYGQEIRMHIHKNIKIVNNSGRILLLDSTLINQRY